MFDFKMSGLCNKEIRGLLKLNISCLRVIKLINLLAYYLTNANI
jgi:hypothetical protein